jgi:hypothetical protein
MYGTTDLLSPLFDTDIFGTCSGYCVPEMHAFDVFDLGVQR